MDLAVIGGGITGVSLLHWAGRSGLDAVLLERERLAAGATGRNAGFLLAGVAANYAEAVELYGRARAEAVWELTLENHRRLADALDGTEVGYRRAGSWIAAADATEADQLREAEALLREDGFRATWVPRPGLAGAELGALLCPDNGELDSAATVRALAAGARGAAREGVEVMSIAENAGGVTISTGGGELRASAAVVATNAWAAELWPGAPVSPVRGQMLITAPVDRDVTDRPVYSDRGFRYWRQRPDRRLVLGGWRNTAVADEVGFDARPTARIQEQLDAHLRRLGVTARVERRWAGTMGFTPDHLPLVGPVPGRRHTFVCAGFSGHGMGFAFEVARILVDHLATGAEVPPWLRSDRESARPSAAPSAEGQAG
jgi:glycine/D-amino acid oxidase-like deaminating enzyme